MKVFKYEALNILRSKWLTINFLAFALLTWAVGRITGDPQRTMNSVASFSVIFVPLIAILFSTLYWYGAERFTHLMLTQPLPRARLYWSRLAAICLLLTTSTIIGLNLGLLVSGSWSLGSLLLDLVVAVLSCTFVAISMWFCVLSNDRMRGVGIMFGLWLYFVLVHDGLVLLLLIAAREYPLDLIGGLLGVTNPIGLARVVLLMANESALLLGHTGALVREVLTGMKGFLIAGGFATIWMVIPSVFGARSFLRRDF